MTGREKEMVGVIKGLGAKATPREIGEILSITTGYAEQLGNMMVRQEYLVKRGKYFALADEFYEQFRYKTEG